MGKGSTYRKVDKAKYDRNYLKIFGRKCPHCKGVGYYKDFGPNKKQKVKTTCLFCENGRIK